jgi:serine/threonine protein kinase
MARADVNGNLTYPILGEGSYGVVIKYNSPRVGTLARKLFLGKTGKQDCNWELRILTKVKGLSSIVSMIGYGELSAGFDKYPEGSFYIDFEMIPGSTLVSLCKNKRIASTTFTTQKRLANFILHLLQAVAWIHEKGVMHLDIKPANIMVTPDYRRGVLIDFGLARTTADNPYTGVFGTEGYQPPEFWNGEEEDFAFDIFSLGATFYELLYGKEAVQVDPGTKALGNKYHREKTNLAEKEYRMAMLRRTNRVEIPPRCPCQFDYVISFDIHALVMLMLHIDKRKRPSARQLLQSDLFTSMFPGRMEEILESNKQNLAKLQKQSEEIQELKKITLDLKKKEALFERFVEERRKAINGQRELQEKLAEKDRELLILRSRTNAFEEELDGMNEEMIKVSKENVAAEERLQEFRKKAEAERIALVNAQALQVTAAVEAAEAALSATHAEALVKLKAELDAAKEELGALKNPSKAAAADAASLAQEVIEITEDDVNLQAPDYSTLTDWLRTAIDSLPTEGEPVQKRPRQVASRNSKGSKHFDYYPFSDLMKTSILNYTQQWWIKIPEEQRTAAWMALHWAFERNGFPDYNNIPAEVREVRRKENEKQFPLSDYEVWVAAALETIRLLTNHTNLNVTTIYHNATGRVAWSRAYAKVKLLMPKI